jgi:hypothetical protein
MMGELALSRGEHGSRSRAAETGGVVASASGFSRSGGPAAARPHLVFAGVGLSGRGREFHRGGVVPAGRRKRQEHIEWPILYVRSFYFLGKIHEARGEKEKARDYYRRFVDYWKDGELDRPRLDEARGRI